MLIADRFELPDKCPPECPFMGQANALSQGSICFRCPVIICQGNRECPALVEPEDYRVGWARAWRDFFVGGCKDVRGLLDGMALQTSDADWTQEVPRKIGAAYWVLRDGQEVVMILNVGFALSGIDKVELDSPQGRALRWGFRADR